MKTRKPNWRRRLKGNQMTYKKGDCLKSLNYVHCHFELVEMYISLVEIGFDRLNLTQGLDF